MKKLPNIEITELMLFKADRDRTFIGQIIRETTDDEKSVVRGNVVVNEGKIWGAASTFNELGNNLDDICVLKLDYGLHNTSGISTIIAETSFFLN